MGRRDQERKPARKKPFRSPKPMILVVCEGKNTEPQYLQGFQRLCHNPRVDIETHGGKGVPKSLVEFAKARKLAARARAKREDDENIEYDAVWCVFDIDDHPDVPGAITMARDNGIQLAVSNPCFELWLLLHFREQPGMQNRDKVIEMVAAFVPDYDKKIDITKFIEDGQYEEAVKRAKRLAKATDDLPEWKRNPSTGVFRLTHVIAEQAQEPEPEPAE